MKEETKPWLEKADENLDLAEYLFEGARYAPACYMCQQTLEVLLKAAIIELAGKRHPPRFTLWLNWPKKPDSN